MSKDTEFVEKLENFALALGDLVETMKEQQKSGPSDVINALAENLDAEKIGIIAENVEKILDNTKTIKTNQDKILSEVQSIKQSRETGMMGEIESKEGKNTILNGVKTIMLISAGVLSIGLAFKIIGKVDFFSVLALGAAIYLVANAFGEIIKIKELSMKNVLITAAMLPIMALGIYASGEILKYMPTMNMFQLLTIVGIGLTMGVTSYLLLKGLEDINIAKNWATILLVPAMLPLIAGGILGAGFILTAMPSVGINQLLTAVGVSIAMTPILLGMGFMVKGLKGVKITDLLIIPLVIPIVAAGLVAASFVLKGIQSFDYGSVALAGLSIGLAVIAMVPTIYILQKAGLLNPKSLLDLTIGAVAIPLIALAIVASSHIFGLGEYGNYPDFEWTAGAGLATIVFALPMLAIGNIIVSSGGIALLGLAAGLLAIPLIALAIVASSHIFGLGNYANYPDVSWTAGVGLSLLAFGVPIMALGVMILASFGLGLVAIAAGIGGVLLFAEAIQLSSHILSKGNYSNYPSLAWSEGVAMSIGSFAYAYKVAMGGSLGAIMSLFGSGPDPQVFLDFIKNIAQALVTAAGVFNASPVSTFDVSKVPSKAWSEGVAISVSGFASAMKDIMSTGGFLGFGGMDIEKFNGAMVSISSALIAAAGVFNASETTNFDLTKVPSKAWAEGVGPVIASFAQILRVMMDGDIEFDDEDEVKMIRKVIEQVAHGIVGVGNIFNSSTGSFDSYPSEEWGKGVSSAVKSMVDVMKMVMDNEDAIEDGSGLLTDLLWSTRTMSKSFESIGDSGKLDSMTASFKNFIDVIPTITELDPLFVLADALERVSDSMESISFFGLRSIASGIGDMMAELDNIDNRKVDSLMRFSMGLNSLALVDNAKLAYTIDLLEAKQKELTGVIAEDGIATKILDAANGLFGGAGTSNDSNVSETSKKDVSFNEALLTHVKSIDDNISTLTKNSNKTQDIGESGIESGSNVN